MKAREYPPLTERIMARFWAKTRIEPDGCVTWTGALDGDRYGKFWLSDTHATGAHRVALAWAEGRCPTDLTVDHLCGNTHCVNPSHLEFVTQAENNLRRALRTTHCPQGHEYSAANTYVRPGTRNRKCRTCKNEQRRALRSAA